MTSPFADPTEGIQLSTSQSQSSPSAENGSEAGRFYISCYNAETKELDRYEVPYSVFAYITQLENTINHDPYGMKQLYSRFIEQCPDSGRAKELAERYHRETEEYDRTVCSGSIFHGSIMPLNSKERALVGANAGRVLSGIMAEAERCGISKREMQRAISDSLPDKIKWLRDGFRQNETNMQSGSALEVLERGESSL